MEFKLPSLLLMSLLLFIFMPYVSAFAQTQEKPFIKIRKAPAFALPLECTPLKDCWVMNYVDMIPDNGQNTDPACLSRTYDAHKGTDFSIPDGEAMKNGINVLAAMDGIIKRTRDNEPDRWASDADLKQTKEQRKECGNAILIDHKDGLQTIYCHMKKGSITVKAHQKVKKGDIIGQVGLSGYTQFPHLHFGVLWEGAIIDPFTGHNNTHKCGITKKSLWAKKIDLEYQPLVIQETGFSDTLPDLKKIEQDSKTKNSLSSNSELLAFWVNILGARTGDLIKIEIKDPNGKIFARREITQPKTRARQFYYTGKRLRNTTLKEGAYTGHVEITRADKGKNKTTNEHKKKWDKTRAILITP